MAQDQIGGHAPTKAPTMKKFGRSRTLDEIRSRAEECGFTVDSSRHDNLGDDHVVVTGMFGGKVAQVLYNTFNGRFFGKLMGRSPVSFNSDSPQFDGKPRFDEMLNFFYVDAVG